MSKIRMVGRFGLILVLAIFSLRALPAAEENKSVQAPKAPAVIGPPVIDEATAPAVHSAPSTAVGTPAPKATAPTDRKPIFAPLLPGKDYTPPILHIEQPKHDFGDVYKGEVIVHKFEMENKGGSPLIVQKVKPSCGCTLVSEAAMDKVIAPGGKGSFELKIETSRLAVGRQSKYADVQTNDPKSPQTRVFVQGKIDTLLKVEPEAPKIQTVKGMGEGKTILTLTKSSTASSTADLKVLGVKSASGRLLLELKETGPGAWQLSVGTNYGPKETQSYFSESIQIEIQIGEKKMNQEIMMTVQVKDRIEITPRSIYYKRTDFQPLRDKGTPAVKIVDMKSALPEPYKFNITDIKLDDPDKFLKVTKEAIKEGREYRLTISVDKVPESAQDQKVQKSLKGNITIITDDELMKETSIRVIAFF